jgi:hypothetical protein
MRSRNDSDAAGRTELSRESRRDNVGVVCLCDEASGVGELRARELAWGRLEIGLDSVGAEDLRLSCSIGHGLVSMVNLLGADCPCGTVPFEEIYNVRYIRHKYAGLDTYCRGEATT